MVLHLVHTPNTPNQGLTADEQCRIGRKKLLEMTFAHFEEKIKGQLNRMLGPGGFEALPSPSIAGRMDMPTHSIRFARPKPMVRNLTKSRAGPSAESQ